VVGIPESNLGDDVGMFDDDESDVDAAVAAALLGEGYVPEHAGFDQPGDVLLQLRERKILTGAGVDEVQDAFGGDRAIAGDAHFADDFTVRRLSQAPSCPAPNQQQAEHDQGLAAGGAEAGCADTDCPFHRATSG
jgi:hypothetical protein